MIKTITKLAIALMVFVQCSSSAMNTANRPKYDPYFIFTEEIRESNYNNAYDLISIVRPVWLRGGVFHSLNFEKTTFPIVYVNGNRYGDMMSLRSISIEKINLIEFLRPTVAVTTYSKDSYGGVISIEIIH